MDELIQAMSIAELETFKSQYADNDSIIKILDGYIEVKTRQEAQDKAKVDFGKAIGKMIDKLPHPDDVHNIYIAWREVEVEDTTQEAEEILVYQKGSKVLPKKVEELTDEERALLDSGELEIECRYPKYQVCRWVVELNKGFTVGKVATGQPVATKRAVTLHKRNGTQLEMVGNFASASKACDHLKLPIGGDSATRVLAREGYILDPYTGTDFTS